MSEKRPRFKELSAEKLEETYKRLKNRDTTIRCEARRLNMSPRTLHTLIHRAYPAALTSGPALVLSRDQVQIVEGKTLHAGAEELSVGIATLRRARKRFGFQSRPRGHPRKIPSK